MTEHEIAVMGGHMIRALDEYFAARPEIDCAESRKSYEAAFQRAWRELLKNTAQIREENSRLKQGITYYAEKNHLMIADDSAWDTVSGEPQNFLCDEAGTATVEDGEIARQVLAGNSFDDNGFIIKNNETTTNPT